MLKLVFSLVVAGLVAGCNPGPPNERGYHAEIAAARAEKDRFLKDDRESPVPADRKGEFLPLRYYPIEPAFNIWLPGNFRMLRPLVQVHQKLSPAGLAAS